MKKYLLIAGCFTAFLIGSLLLWNRLPYNRDPAELPTVYPAKPIEVQDFDTITLEVIGMRFHHTYEIINEPQLLQSCSVGEWDGFHGEHPKDVQDGSMFTFMAVVNDGQIIRAEGSENFPEGYITFEQAINDLLSAYTD